MESKDVEEIKLEVDNEEKSEIVNGWILKGTIAIAPASKIRIAINSTTKEKIAWKILSNTSESRSKQFLRNLNIMKKLKHQNVIQIMDLIERDDGNINIMMELASNGELNECIMFSGCLNEYASRTYFHQIIDGFEALHKLEVIHGDFSPYDLLLDKDYNLKIGGFAAHHGLNYKSKTLIPPEIVKGKEWTTNTDIFCIGHSLFCIYAGFPPFQYALKTDWWWEKLSKGCKYKNAAEKQKYAPTLKDRMKHIGAATQKTDLFWRAHERTRLFSHTLKTLIEGMLHPYTEYRYNIKQIKSHKWYHGKIFNQQELKEYMKKKMEDAMKERDRSIQKDFEPISGKNERFRKNNYYMDCPMGNKVKHRCWDGCYKFKVRAKELDPNNEFMANICKFKDDGFIDTAYKFYTNVDPSEMAAGLEYYAKNNQMEVTVSAKDNTILYTREYYYQQSKNVMFISKQCLIDDDDEMVHKARYIVLFKRLKGASFEYEKLIEDMYRSKEVVDARYSPTFAQLNFCDSAQTVHSQNDVSKE